MKKSNLRYALAIVVLAGAAFAAQPDRPVVTMTIAPAGEKPHEVEVRESGLAAVKVKGAEFGFRPGGPAVQSKTKPGFTISVTKVVEKS